MLIFQAPFILRHLFLSWLLQIGLLSLHLLTACCLNLTLRYLKHVSLKAEFAFVCFYAVAFVRYVTLNMRINLPFSLTWLEKVQKYVSLAEQIKNITTA